MILFAFIDISNIKSNMDDETHKKVFWKKS